MRCGLCWRTFAGRAQTRFSRVLRPICWDCANTPRHLYGWRALLASVGFVGLACFELGRWIG